MSWDVGSWVIDTVNSVLGTLIQAHGTQTFTSDGTFTVPSGVADKQVNVVVKQVRQGAMVGQAATAS